MEERDNRNVMCSVLFLDIVEYSKKTVAEQISLKDRFNSYLSTAIRDIPVDDRIILDTGDGAAINFLGDVEDALKTALSLRESMLNEDPDMDPPLLVRMGINLGPVRLVRDINGQPNIVGDGINVAQRVMAFADASQILVSRSYYDAASRVSPNYAGMFHHQGSRTDKHVREHEIYAIGYPGDKTSKLATKKYVTQQVAKISWREKLGLNFPLAEPGAMAGGLLGQLRQIEPMRRVLYAGMLVIVILVIVILKLAHVGKTPAGQVQVVSSTQPASAVAPVASAVAPVVSAVTLAASASPHAESMAAATGNAATPVTKGKSDQIAESKMGVGQVKQVVLPKMDNQPVSAAKPATKGQPGKTVESKTDPEQAKTLTKRAESKTNPEQAKPAPKPAAQPKAEDVEEHFTESYILVACHEGAHIYVDGADKGKLTSTKLSVGAPPGKHQVIVNGRKGEIYDQQVELKPGKILTIKPDFCNP